MNINRRSLLWLLFSLPFAQVVFGAWSIDETRRVSPGLKYYVYSDSTEMWQAFVLKVELDHPLVELKSVKAHVLEFEVY